MSASLSQPGGAGTAPAARVRRPAPLTADQQLKLWRRAVHDGDQAAREQLLLGNQGLICALARQLSGSAPVTYPELVQEGNLALLDAVERFSPETGTPFPAWAAMVIRRALSDYCAAQRQLGGVQMRLPRQTWRHLQSLRDAEQQLIDAGRTPDADALARVTGLPVAAVNKLLFLRIRRREEIADQLQTLSGDQADGNPERSYLDVERRQALHAALAELEPRQREVLAARFGLDGQTPCSEEELAVQWGCSRSAVAGLQRRALAQLSGSALRRWR